MNYFKKHMFDKLSLAKDDFGKRPEDEPAPEEEAEVNEDELFEFAEFDEKRSEIIAAPRYSYWKSVWKTFISSKFTVAVAILMIVVVVFAFVYPAFSDYDPMVAPHINDAEYKHLKPSFQHIFGTDDIGNEVFDVVWAGARNSLIVSLTATAINMIIGISVGAIDDHLAAFLVGEKRNVFANGDDCEILGTRLAVRPGGREAGKRLIDKVPVPVGERVGVHD